MQASTALVVIAMKQGGDMNYRWLCIGSRILPELFRVDLVLEPTRLWPPGLITRRWKNQTGKLAAHGSLA